jgi:predicted amidohydrolase
MDAAPWAALIAGSASGALSLVARRVPLFAWVALTPCGLALSTCGGWALTGAVVHGPVMLTQPARLRPLGFLFGGVGWGIAAGVGGLIIEALRPARILTEPLALLFVLPLVALVAALPMRLAGAPRWVYAALACTQEAWPVVIRAGWFGGDVMVSALLSLSAAAVCLLVPGATWSPGLAALLFSLVLVVLAASARSLARTRAAIERQPRVRIAAVVVNGKPPEGALPDGLWPLFSPEYGDVDATIRRYTPHVAHAARECAQLIILPEVAVRAGDADANRWLDAAAHWAREHGITVIAPYFEPSKANTLAVIEPSGRRWTHDKQHPAPGLEPAPRVREPPGPYLLERGWPVSTAICVDLDYPDLIAPVRAAGGLLVVPANDWPGPFAELHHRSAVWAAVLSETTVIRATGHGICSARDGAGAVLAQASSIEKPTVMVVDVPVASPRG